MIVYVIAQLKFTKRELYNRYSAAFPAVFKKFKGVHLVSDENVKVLDGKWDRDKLVIMSFPDEAAAIEFRNSPEYQEIAVDRRAGADGIVLMAKGKAPD
jgi:uncharacterized protein (DUF1330 family)